MELKIDPEFQSLVPPLPDALLTHIKGVRTFWKNFDLVKDFHAELIDEHLLWVDNYGTWWNNNVSQSGVE